MQRDLARACARYERAIAALDERSSELEHPRAKDVVRAAVAESTDRSAVGVAPEHPVSLSSASFDDLRGLGLSTTQARRVLKLRDRGVLESTAELDSVPGLPRSQVAALKLRLSD